MVNGQMKLPSEWTKLVSKFFLNEYLAAEKKFGKLNIPSRELGILLYLRYKGYITHKIMREVFTDMIEEKCHEND